MKRIKNSKGQMTVEAVLLLVIFVAFVNVAHRTIKEKEVLRNMVSGPWSFLQGMIQNGVWAPENTGSDVHPNVYGRRASPEPI